MADRIFRLRVTYSLNDRLSMLSHLETARALERIVRRAHLPFAVTNGFSPHMKIAFGSALPVGVGGSAEIFDIFLTDYLATDTVLKALVKAAPESMPIRDCSYVPPAAPAASVVYPISVYEAILSSSIDAVVVPEKVSVVRKGKEKTLVVDEYLVGNVEFSDNIIRFSLEAKPTGSLRPDVFLKACTVGSDGRNLADMLVSLRRIAQYENASDLRSDIDL